MLRTTSLFSAAIAAVTIAMPIAAQSVDQDARCAIVSNVAAKQEKDPVKQRFANAAAFFYLGRLDAKLSSAQISATMMAQGKAMKATDLNATMNACASRLAQKTRALQALGQQADKPKPK